MPLRPEWRGQMSTNHSLHVDSVCVSIGDVEVYKFGVKLCFSWFEHESLGLVLDKSITNRLKICTIFKQCALYSILLDLLPITVPKCIRRTTNRCTYHIFHVGLLVFLGRTIRLSRLSCFQVSTWKWRDQGLHPQCRSVPLLLNNSAEGYSPLQITFNVGT